MSKTSNDITFTIQAGLSVDPKTFELCMGLIATYAKNEGLKGLNLRFPSSYNQTRNVMLNYEVLANIYRQRKGHKLDEWREFCKWIESLPYSELIVGGEEVIFYADNKEVKDEQN